MLRTDDRLLLTDALAVPSGYRLDALVGTTFSLHLGALLSLPLSFTFLDWEDADGSPTQDPVTMLAAVRRYADHMTVFCQAGATAVTKEPPVVASWLEDVLIPVKAPFGGVFHPKVWVARYVSTERAPRYRVLCGSRNLTFDRCWDTVVVLDGERTARGGVARETGPLADFVGQLPSFAVGAIGEGRGQTVVGLADELRRVRFEAPQGFSAIRFWPLGIAGHQADPLESVRRRRMLVVSPFLGSPRLAELGGEAPDGILVTRGEELERIPAASLQEFEKCYVLDEPEVAEDPDAADGILRGLHAKLYVADDGGDARVWSGSANATHGAAARNVEFLIQLDGRKNVCGIDQVLLEGPSALIEMLVEAEKQESPKEPDLKEQLQRELDSRMRAFAERRLVAEVSPGSVEGEFDVELHSAEPWACPSDVAATCWPLTAPAQQQRLKIEPGTSLARFRGQRLASVTAFYVVALELSREGERVECQTLVRADLVGVADGRSDAVLRDVLQDPEQVIRLIRALLQQAEDGSPTEGQISSRSDDVGTGNGWGGDQPLLESLLRALVEAPEQLEAVRGVINDLRQTPELLPSALVAICEPILSVYEASRR